VVPTAAMPIGVADEKKTGKPVFCHAQQALAFIRS